LLTAPAAAIGSLQPIEEESDFDAPELSQMVAKGASIA
jgi:hypothetical protein